MDEFEERKKDKRKDRFQRWAHQSTSSSKRRSSTSYWNSDQSGYQATGDLELDWENLKIVGTSEELEKPYLRLTSVPLPEKIRPERVLKKTYDMLVRKWEENPNYKYTNTQFKSLRQDLLVQNIRNEFAVKSYETHARIAISIGDLSEYNQCQTQLWELYHENEEYKTNFHEFMCYRALYYSATNNTQGLVKLLETLKHQDRKSDAVKYALKVHFALKGGNYFEFFKLLKSAPYSSSFILLKLQDFVRFQALKLIAKGYRPSNVPVKFCAKQMNMKENEFTEWARACGAVVEDEKLVTKKIRSLKKPKKAEPKDADDKRKGVTHGFFD